MKPSIPMTGEYDVFLSSVCGRQWRRIGARRRAGVNVPLFSLYSAESAGAGEIPDLKLLVDWCVKTGLSIIQLLPMNDVGFDFRPYDAQSTFALEPLFLRLSSLAGVKKKFFDKEVSELRKKFPAGQGRVDYGIKAAKLELLARIFASCEGDFPSAFETFRMEQSFWLRPYTFFKVLKEQCPNSGWEGWEPRFRAHEESALAELEKASGDRLLFHAWLQWQLAEQFKEVKAYANLKGVYLMGDLPFLVSRDSADAWWHQEYFKLDRVSGAPPDAYIAEGQRWGMPPYRWEAIAARGYDYIREKIRYAAHFYDMFRIDHVVGLFRLWTIAENEPYENAGRFGSFDPQDENLWEDHGRRILSAMVEPTDMLPCAEDLGVVPDCSNKVLGEFSVPGMDVQRWARHWNTDGSFKSADAYRACSSAVISTHDMPILFAWWMHEAGTVDEWLFRQACQSKGLDAAEVIERLFQAPAYGRLRWKHVISGVDDLIRALGRAPQEIESILSLCRDSFEEKKRFLAYLGFSGQNNEPPAEEVIRKALERVSESRSVFSVQLIHDWLSLSGYFSEDPWNARVNFPGSVGPHNWSVVLPISLETMLMLESNKIILEMQRLTGRA